MNSLHERLRVLRRSVFGLLVVAGGFGGACGDPRPTPTLGTNSNWLVTCAGDADCTGQARCECARCTLTCALDADCDALGDARCALAATAASLSQCGTSATPDGLCLRGCGAGDCAEDEACVSGACVACALPDNDFCAMTSSDPSALRADEDELFELVQALRAAGGVVCGAASPSAPASKPVVADGRLRCAARALAADIDAHGTRGLVDSSARTTRDRLEAAGHAATLWAEGYAVSSRAPSDALAVILGDDGACTGVTRDGYTALGVAHVGSAYVVTLAAD